MPVSDTRRVCAPVESKPWSTLNKYHDDWPLLDKENKRKDGRKFDEIRPMFLRSGIVTQAKGSSYLETVGTKVVCSVYGPRESPRKQEFSSSGRLTCDFTFAPFARTNRISPRSDENEANVYANLVVDAFQSVVCLETFPKAQVDIYIKVLEDTGGLLALSLIAASAALAEAGIEMFGLLSACSVCFSDSETIYDPTNDELAHPSTKGLVSIGYVPALNQICSLMQDGCTTLDKSQFCIKACIEGSLRTHKVLQDCLTESVKRKSVDVKS